MKQEENRFEEFFADDAYIKLKNSLYNYLLRKRAINSERGETPPLLEVGSGISPISSLPRTVYSDLSHRALSTLKREKEDGFFVVADAAALPFRPETFAQVVCSEVIEHVKDDRKAIKEITAVLRKGGHLLLTFPHRRSYFANDDVLVGHYRRYELEEMLELLGGEGLATEKIRKILGPLEKVIMILLCHVVSRITIQRERRNELLPKFSLVFCWLNKLLYVLAWLDALLTPLCLASVVLIKAEKR